MANPPNHKGSYLSFWPHLILLRILWLSNWTILYKTYCNDISYCTFPCIYTHWKNQQEYVR